MKRFWKKIVNLCEKKQKREAFLEQNCSVIKKKTEARSVFGTKLFCYGKEHRCVNRFRHEIVLVWEREEKCESFSVQNCSLIGKTTEVQSVFGTKLFTYEIKNKSAKRFWNKIVLLWEREEKCEAFLGKIVLLYK